MSFTKEQAKSTSILSIASSLGIELKKVSSNIYEWTEHDSFKIYENTNSFSWFSQSIHGDAIALVQTIKEVSFRDAIKYIESGDLPEVAIDNSPKKPFQYYLAPYEYDHIKQGRTFLGDTRGLSEDTITTFRSKGLLAQARLKGSDGIFEPVLVFKFLNKDKKIIGCSLQGIHENYLRHEHGRLKKVLGDGSTGLNIDIGTPERLIFLEAPIDLMSYYELNKNRLENVRLVSMDGLKDTTISRHLYELLAEKEGLTDINLDDAKKLLPILANTNFFELGANRELITLAVDNDKAGLGFIEKLNNKNIKFNIDLPPLENNQEKMDWNDFLKQKKALDLSQEPNIGSGTFNRTSSSLDSQAVKEVPQPVEQVQPTFPTNAQLHFSITNPQKSIRKPSYYKAKPKDLTKINRYASVIQDSAKWYEDTLAGSKISYLYLDQNKPEILKEESIQLSDKSFDSEFPSEVSEEKSVSDMILEKDTKGLSEHMKKGIKNYLQSDQYATFLKAMGKLHNYSPKNIQLLLSQNKNISMVAGFNTWKKDFQRTVNKGEKSLKIWMPFTVKQKDENGKIKLDDQGKPITFTGFKLGSVFDVSQTNGKDIPKALYELSETKEDYQDLYRSLRATLQESQIDIEWKNLPEAKGYYSPTENKIVLKSGLSSTHTIKTILHEMAHSRLHKDGSFDKLSEAYKLQELQAESIAYVVSNHFGIDTGAYSFGYLASWSDDKKGLSDFESQLSIIQSEAKKIIDTVDAKLEKIKEKGTIENTFENKFSSFKQSKTDKEVGNNLSQNLEKANGL